MSIRPIPTNSPAKPLSRSLSSCLALCCALLQKSKAHPLAFQSLPCSLQKHGGLPPKVFVRLFHFEQFNFLSRNSFRRNTYSRSPRFTVFWPQSSAHKSPRINTYRYRVGNSFIRNTYKKRGGRGWRAN